MNTAGIFRSLRLVIGVLLTISQVSAADPLRLKLSTVASIIRSHAPVSLNVHLDWASPTLLEGRLEFTCYDGEKLLHRNVESEVALFAGDRHSRTVLPPMSLASDQRTLTVNARFLSDTENYDLGTFELRVPVFWRRSFVIGVVLPDKLARGAESGELGQALRLDQLSGDEISARELVSIPSQITPENLRSSGLGLFSYDVLALTSPGFKALEKSQLDAIGDWVEAGGSVLVIIDDVNSAEQTRFLNRIAGLPGSAPGEYIGSEALPTGGIGDQSGRLRMYYPGLGRSVILLAESQTVANTDLRAATAHLWKLRSEMQSEFHRTGSSLQFTNQLSGSGTNQSGSGTNGAMNWQPGNDDYDVLYSPFQQVPLQEMDSLATILLPDDVQTIPLSVVVLILALFLTAIVPVDYYVLGRFNLRRFTWILLPVVSLVFTGFTAWLGNAYLGSTDYRTSLEFVDLTTGNRVIRNSRFEMLFTATQKEVATELKQSLYADVSVDSTREADKWDSGRGMMTSDIAEETVDRTDQSNDAASSLYEGNMPTLFTVRQRMRKWSPKVSRQTSFQTERPIPQFKLDDIRANWQQSSDVLTNLEKQRSLRDEIQTVLPESTVLLFTQNRVLDLTRGEDLQNLDKPSVSSDTKSQKLIDLVCKVCVRPAVGFFSIASQISPNGAGDFEDLSILDPNDAGQLLLVIVTRQGDDYVVFRRVYHKGS